MSTIQEYVRQRVTSACDEHGVEADSLLRYLEHGIKPGSFLTAVIEDRLVEAANCADEFNKRRLWEWAAVMYLAVPANARGPEGMTKWIERGGLLGTGNVEREEI